MLSFRAATLVQRTPCRHGELHQASGEYGLQAGPARALFQQETWAIGPVQVCTTLHCTALYGAKGGGVKERYQKLASAMKDEEPDVLEEAARFDNVLPRALAARCCASQLL